MTKPTFLIIGGMKCGTTSLWRYLRGHADVAMAEPKELHFFSRQWENGWAWYESHFSDDSRIAARGEASPSYAELHFFPEVPERIAEGLPDVRLVYLVRDPIDRLQSHYLHNLDRGFERTPLAKAVWASPTYTDIGLSARHVEAYHRCLAPSQLLVVRSERLRDDRLAALDEIAAFVGIGDDWPDVHEEYGRTPTLTHRVRRDGRRRGAFAAATAVVRHVRFDRMARLSDTLRSELVDYFRPDVKRLRPHLDVGFDGWGIA